LEVGGGGVCHAKQSKKKPPFTAGTTGTSRGLFTDGTAGNRGFRKRIQKKNKANGIEGS